MCPHLETPYQCLKTKNMLDAFQAQVHRAVTGIHTSAVALLRMARRSQQPGAAKTYPAPPSRRMKYAA
jgi:hypothetical protein